MEWDFLFEYLVDSGSIAKSAFENKLSFVLNKTLGEVSEDSFLNLTVYLIKLKY